MDDLTPALPLTVRVIPLAVRFMGTGVLEADGHAISGGVAEPEIGSELRFSMWREVPDDAGLLNPVPGEATIDGSFQLSVTGTSAGYRELASYLLAIAELDVGADPDFHEHHEVVSEDRRTRLHIIIRRGLERPVT